MKLFIMTDLEGATGVAGSWEDFSPGAREHLSAKRFLTGDVNAAVEGALEAGIGEVVVLDGHGAAFSILLEELNPKAQLIRGRRVLELEGLNETFSLMFAVGAHAMAGAANGLLTHTFSLSILNMWLNNQLIGEIGIWATIAGHFHVPLSLAVGDRAAVEEAKTLLGNIETVAVKEATSRFAATCYHPTLTQRLIKEASKSAVLNLEGSKPYRPKPPLELKVEYLDAQVAERIARRLGVTRVDARTVSCTVENILEAMALVL